MARLEGKAAIITGATGGIGETTTKLFLDEGAAVMLVGRSPESLAAVRDRLSAGKRVEMSVAEARVDAAMEAAVAATIKAFGSVDILFANAGMTGAVPIEAYTQPKFEEILLTNVVGAWLPMKQCVEPMKRRGGGSIIATASIAGVAGIPGLAAYAASKHGVCGLVKTAALELATSRIRVSAIAPGPIDNRMTAAAGRRRCSVCPSKNMRQTLSEWTTIRKPSPRGFPHMLVSYMRVSTDGDRQVLDLQRDALLAAGVDERHLHEGLVTSSGLPWPGRLTVGSVWR